MIKRGDIYWIIPPGSTGSVQRGNRPGVIIQNDIGNQYSPVTIVAVCTSNVTRIYPTDVFITADETGLLHDPKILCNQIQTISKDQLGSQCGTVPKEKMWLVDEALKISLGII